MLPEAPVDSSINETTQAIVTGVMAAFALAALIFSLLYWRRTGRPTFLILFVAGGLMMIHEPMVDTVGAVWFPEGNSWVAFEAWGRPIPVWLCLAYFFYFGIGVGAEYLMVKKTPTARTLWTLFGIGMLGDFLFEVTLLAFDTYIYYGDQPLVVAKFPLWWAPVNSLIVMIAVCAIYLLRDWLRGWRQLLIIPIALTASAAGNAVAGWPSWFVINTDLGWVGTQVGGLLTFTFAIWVMYGLIQLTLSRAEAPPGPAASPAPAREAVEPVLAS